MIKKKAAHSVSIVNRLTLLMLILGILALIVLSVSTRITDDTKGSAYMINQLGLLRMKNYQLLSMVPLPTEQYFRLNLFINIPLTNDYNQLLDHYELLDDFNQLQVKWQQEISPKIQYATDREQIRIDIQNYVLQIDNLVQSIDHKTEQQIATIARLQILFIVIIVLFVIVQIYYLRRHLLIPLKQLLKMAESISRHDFSQRFKLVESKQDEFDLLGHAFNNMSEQIESQYSRLTERVKEKTTELHYRNRILSFLYLATKILHSSAPLCERFLTILYHLEKLTPLSQFQIRFYVPNDPDHDQDACYGQVDKLSFCYNSECSACVIPPSVSTKRSIKRHWYLQSEQSRYGEVVAVQAYNQPLNDRQEKLLAGLIEQMTVTLLLEQQIEKQKQYLLIKERSAMARELHDSIAQSLSCLKINISCLQMQSDLVSDESQMLLQTMRKEVNVAYAQLRELITSFRLQFDQTSFYASVQETINEFNHKLGFEIKLTYQLPLHMINSMHAIHLLQIIREALNNIYKYAQASHVAVSLTVNDDQIIYLSIQDNGIGMQDKQHKNEHYGLIIMQNRTELLDGFFNIETAPYQGSKITVTFKEQSNLYPENM